MNNNSIYIFEQLGRYFILSRAMLGLKIITQSEHIVALGVLESKFGDRGISKTGTISGLVACANCISQVWADGSKMLLEFISNCRDIRYLTSTKKNVFGYIDFDLYCIYIFQTVAHSTTLLPILHSSSEYPCIHWDYV